MGRGEDGPAVLVCGGVCDVVSDVDVVRLDVRLLQSVLNGVHHALELRTKLIRRRVPDRRERTERNE
jgi:hypothetical protein